MQQDQQPTSPPEQWAIVELFGHARIAGRIGEHWANYETEEEV